MCFLARAGGAHPVAARLLLPTLLCPGAPIQSSSTIVTDPLRLLREQQVLLLRLLLGNFTRFLCTAITAASSAGSTKRASRAPAAGTQRTRPPHIFLLDNHNALPLRILLRLLLKLYQIVNDLLDSPDRFPCG